MKLTLFVLGLALVAVSWGSAYADRIAIGEDFTCAISSDGRPYCWGVDFEGVLGVSSTAHSKCVGPSYVGGATYPCVTSPAPVQGIPVKGSKSKVFTDIAANTFEVCALASTGYVTCWGHKTRDYNPDWRAGEGTDTVVFFRSPPREYTMGRYLTTVISAGRRAICMGYASSVHCFIYEENRIDGDDESFVAIEERYSSGLPRTAKVVELAVGDDKACALMNNHSVWCWTIESKEAAQPLVGAESGATSVAMINQSIAVIVDGKLKTAGPGTVPEGRMNIPSQGSDQLELKNVFPQGVVLTKVRLGEVEGCATDTTGALWCWGLNGNGALGTGKESKFDMTPGRPPQPVYSGPAKVAKLNSVSDFAVSGVHACAIK